MKGDVSLTFTLPDLAGTVTLVTASPQGRSADDRTGRLPRSKGTGAQETKGNDAQETTGRAPRGNNGRVS